MKFKLWVLSLVVASSLFGADFGWMGGMNDRYVSDPRGFQTGLNNRFNVGEAIISSVIQSVAKPADAYMILKFAEMTGMKHTTVLQNYNTNKKKGWGAMAQSLGIKPGSAEFKALKAGHDLDRGRGFGGDDDFKKDKKKGKDKDKKDKY